MTRSIGILVTGSPPDELAGRYHGHYGTMVEQLLREALPGVEFRHYDVRNGEFPAGPDAHDAYVITGSRHAAYEQLGWIERLAQFIREVEAVHQPLVGICFGHQLIARALGGTVVKAPQGWGVGVHEAQVDKPAPWMEGGPVRMVVSHQDQVTELPPRAERLAGSEFCPIAMYRIGEHVFAMQAHPEFTRQYSRDLMEVRRTLIGDERIDAGMQSLASDVDSPEVAGWIASFLNRAWTR